MATSSLAAVLGGAVAAAAAASFVQSEQRIMKQLREADAVSADRAKPLHQLKKNDARQLARMVERGIIRQGSGDSYWLDLAAYDAERQKNKRLARLLAVLSLVLVLTTAALVFGLGRF